jgi:hypothetical protein
MTIFRAILHVSSLLSTLPLDGGLAHLRKSPPLQSETKISDSSLPAAMEGADMRTTILAYVISFLGVVMICGGSTVFSIFGMKERH